MIPRVAVLSIVGALLGMAAMVAVGAAIFGPDSGRIPTQLDGPGRSVLTITPADVQAGAGSAPTSRAAPLTQADVDAITRDVLDLAALSRAVFGTALVTAGGRDGQTRIEAVDPSFVQVTGALLAQGTFFSAVDERSANRVAVLGQTVSRRLFQNGQTPIGATIRIRNVPYAVIGVLATQRGGALEDPDDAVLIPFQTGQVRLFGATALDAVLVQVTAADRADPVKQRVEQILRQRHQVRAGQPDGFSIRSSPSAPTAEIGGAATQVLGHLLALARQYNCEAKGLCAPAPGYS